MPDAVPVAQKENSHYTYRGYNDPLAQAEFYFHYLLISIYFYVIRWPETSNQATFLRSLDKILLYMMQCKHMAPQIHLQFFSQNEYCNFSQET